MHAIIMLNCHSYIHIYICVCVCVKTTVITDSSNLSNSRTLLIKHTAYKVCGLIQETYFHSTAIPSCRVLCTAVYNSNLSSTCDITLSGLTHQEFQTVTSKNDQIIQTPCTCYYSAQRFWQIYYPVWNLLPTEWND